MDKKQAALYLSIASVAGPKKAVDWYLWLTWLAIGAWFFIMFVMD